MKLRILWIGRSKERSIQSLTDEYLKRISRYVPVEAHELASEAALLRQVERSSSRPFVVLLDARGKQLSSQEFAEFLADHQNRGTQSLMFALGPADGFSAGALAQADFRLSLGKMTIAHELARVLLLEQIYRAFSILKGHPYHLGH